MILVLGFACIIKVKGIENSARIALGETDCTQFTFLYSGDPSWSSIFNLNSTAFQTTRLDVAESEYPKYYNNSYPVNGLLGCYCLYVAEQDPQHVLELEFQNPYTKKTDYLCDDFFTEYQYIQVRGKNIYMHIFINMHIHVYQVNYCLFFVTVSIYINSNILTSSHFFSLFLLPTTTTTTTTYVSRRCQHLQWAQ
jgi:hypothetical protein